MTNSTEFGYDKFLALSDLDVVAYVEPFLGDPSLAVPQDALRRMLSDLPTYDEAHLVYALELGAAYSPETFASKVPLYLAHEHGSVRCAASRFLEHLPEKLVTRELIDSVRKALASYPDHLSPKKEFFAGVLDSLRMRLPVS
jgi:hypothetical protein